MTLFVHATNIHSGGGAELLSALLAEIRARSLEATALVDARLPLLSAGGEKLKLIAVRPTVVERLKAERLLRHLAGVGDLIFSAGNLPPLFAVKAPVCLFLQNRYLVDRVSLDAFPLPVRLRIAAERYWLKQRISRVARIMVQTPTMATLLLANFARNAEILPFAGSLPLAEPAADAAEPAAPRKYDFVYVASGEPHKNHLRLFEAWELLAAEGIRPSLCVTLALKDGADLGDRLQRALGKGAVIDNVGRVPREQVNEIYRSSRALIYPSTLESFGLPLLEAQVAGLDIVAAELDYVRDAVDPLETFDPASSLSISRAVRRYLGLAIDREKLRSAGEILEKIIGA